MGFVLSNTSWPVTVRHAAMVAAIRPASPAVDVGQACVAGKVMFDYILGGRRGARRGGEQEGGARWGGGGWPQGHAHVCIITAWFHWLQCNVAEAAARKAAAGCRGLPSPRESNKESGLSSLIPL